MRITARGWRRDSGPTLICDHEVKGARPDTQGSYSPDVLYFERSETGIELCVGPATLTLGGRYQITVRLTNDDIARLFLACYPDLRATLQGVFAKAEPPAAAAE